MSGFKKLSLVDTSMLEELKNWKKSKLQQEKEVPISDVPLKGDDNPFKTHVLKKRINALQRFLTRLIRNGEKYPDIRKYNDALAEVLRLSELDKNTSKRLPPSNLQPLVANKLPFKPVEEVRLEDYTKKEHGRG